MGSGKTYWGQRLAEAAGLPFRDLDAMIECGEKNPAGQIFAERGEAAFRQLERTYLHLLAPGKPSIVATGGGTPCFFDNLAWMNAQGITVYLDTPVPVLTERLRRDSDRPLLKNIPPSGLEDYIRDLVSVREVFYQKAQFTVPFHLDPAVYLERLLRVFSGAS